MSNGIIPSLKINVTVLAIVAVLLPPTIFAQSLEEAVVFALDSHPKIRQAFNRFKASEEQVKQAFSGYYPTIDFEASMGREWTESPSTRADALTYDIDKKVDLTRREIGVSFGQILFDGFQTSSDVNSTEYEASAEQWTLFAIAENLALDVARAYLELMRAEKIVILAKRNLNNHRTIYNAIKQKTDLGLGSTADLSQITGRLARAYSSLISSKNNLSDISTKYKKLVNFTPKSTLRPVPNTMMQPTSLKQALDMSTTTHPMLKAADSNINAASAQHKSSQGRNYPQVTLSLNAGWDDNLDGTDGFSPISADVGGGHDEVLAMIHVSYNLFSGGADSARKRETAYNINESKAIHNEVYRDIIEGTTLAWNAKYFLSHQITYLHQYVISAIETRNAYKNQFKIGQRTLINILDAEDELFQARREYLTAEYDYLFAQYRLFNATGQLLKSLQFTMPKVWLGENNYKGGVK